MLIDTHCHLNMMVKTDFDVPLTASQIHDARAIIDHAATQNVTIIINVGTSVVESLNCIALARAYDSVYASVGVHPNDCTDEWRADMQKLEKLVREKEKNKIVAIGETGLDRHYSDYNLPRQIDAFKAQIELSLAHDLALIVHTRQAPDETLRVLEEFKHDIRRCVIHCFSEDAAFAREVRAMGFVLGIGGTVTYPNNKAVRAVVETFSLDSFVLETDAPFLPPQIIRGQKNSPAHIDSIARYIAELRGISYQEVAQQTSTTARALFNLTLASR